MAAEILNKPM